MSVAVRSGTRLPISLRLEEDLTGGDRQGIGTILGFSSSTERKATQIPQSLRRTFSADMSSKKWLTQHIPGTLKKTASSQEFSEMSVPDSSSSSEGEEDEGDERKKEAERPGQSDIWNLIQSQKPATDANSPLPPPYIHPLLKRSSRSLSKKSLEICTESLGSETGSDSFSPPASPDYRTSDSSDEETGEERVPIAVEQEPTCEKKESEAVNYPRLLETGKAPPRSFPPPLPSISRHDGPRLLMKPHRKDGRLVLEAISITYQNNFHAERQDGRLVLSFANTQSAEAKHDISKEEEGQETNKLIIEDETVEEVDKVTIKQEIVLEVKIVQEDVATAVMKVRRPTLVMSKMVSEVVQLDSPNPWMGRTGEERDALKRAAASFSGYNRVAVFDDRQTQSGPGKLVTRTKPVMVMKPEEILPMMMRCVERSRPLLFWAPRCIATT